MRKFLVFFVLAVIAVVALMGIRGRTFTSPPLEIFTDMKRQYKLKPQGENQFFADGRNDRANPTGTVATQPDHLAGQIQTPAYIGDPVVATGKNTDGTFYKGIPIPVTLASLAEGKKKFEINCAACHGYLGLGNGVTQAFGMLATANLQQERIVNMPEGEIFNTVSNGKGQMLGLKNKLNTYERWNVVAYLKALQLSQNQTTEALPAK